MTAQLSKKSEAWSARFNEPVSDLVKRYTASVFFDQRLAKGFVELWGLPSKTAARRDLAVKSDSSAAGA